MSVQCRVSVGAQCAAKNTLGNSVRELVWFIGEKGGIDAPGEVARVSEGRFVWLCKLAKAEVLKDVSYAYSGIIGSRWGQL